MPTLEIVVADRHIPVGAFQIDYEVSDEDLGQWMRKMIDDALDASASGISRRSADPRSPRG